MGLLNAFFYNLINSPTTFNYHSRLENVVIADKKEKKIVIACLYNSSVHGT